MPPTAPHKTKCTIADVAKAAGVSTATVSRVLNGSPRVTSDTAAHVRCVIEKLGYIPQSAARNLAQQKTHTIGVLMQEIGNDFSAQILRGIESVTSQSDYDLLIASKTTQSTPEGPALPLGPHNTDGVIVMAGFLPKSTLQHLHQNHFPIVLLYEKTPEKTPIPTLQIENRHSTFLLIQHLITCHHHRRIAFLRGPANNLDSREREQGLRDAFEAHRLEFSPDLVGDGCFDENTAYAVVRGWIEEGQTMDAIFGGSDEGAIGAVMALKDAGLSVPDDVAVVGFDDLNHARLLSPPLTTVHAPTEEVGQLAATQLLKILAGEKVELTTTLPSNLILRASCGCRQGNRPECRTENQPEK
jgi:DNA-binding LacI/PurR family transcriptional regulator